MNFAKLACTAAALAAALFLGGCPEEKKTPVDRLEQRAQEAAREAAAATAVANEIEMIEFRRKVMGKPGLQMYVVFLNDMGQPIDYFIAAGKCSSSNKRLTDGTKAVQGDRGSYYGWFDVPAASEDGTHGESDEYIYCKTVDGKYKQWNGDYLASDAPIELQIKPLVMDVLSGGRSGIQSQQ